MTDIHEIGHMLGFKDRYSDLIDNKGKISGAAHQGFGDDLMGSGTNPCFSYMHSQDMGRYALDRMRQQQSLLPQYRSNTFEINRIFDSFRSSSVAPSSIPPGSQLRYKE